MNEWINAWKALLGCYYVPGVMPGLRIINFIYAFSFFFSWFPQRGDSSNLFTTSHRLYFKAPSTYISFNSHLSRICNIFSTISIDGVKKNHSEALNTFPKGPKLVSSRGGMKNIGPEPQGPSTMQRCYFQIHGFIHLSLPLSWSWWTWIDHLENI